MIELHTINGSIIYISYDYIGILEQDAYGGNPRTILHTKTGKQYVLNGSIKDNLEKINKRI